MSKVRQPPRVKSLEQEAEMQILARGKTSGVRSLRQTGRIADNMFVPDAVISQKKGEKPYDTNPAVASPRNAADMMVKKSLDKVTEWHDGIPGRHEDFVNKTSDYRGEGLLPTDKVEGIKVTPRK